MKYLITLFLLLCITLLAHAQIRSLTLSECIKLGTTVGPNGKMLRSSFQSKRLFYKSFDASLLPSLRLQGTVPDLARTINPIVQPDGTTKFIEQSQANSNLFLTLSQPLVFTGGNIFVSSGLNWNRMLNDNLTTWRSSPLQIGIQQPIFSINTLRWDNQENELRTTIAEKEYNEDFEDAGIQVTQKFFDAYVAQMRVQNAALNVTINDSLLTLSRGRFDVGKIDENDLLQSELALANAQTDKANAELDYRIAMKSLGIALGFAPEESFMLVAPTDTVSIIPTVDHALREAKANRSDIENFELQHVTAERGIQQARSSNGLNATITASFGLNQTASDIQGAYSSFLDQQLARLDVSVPLWQWNKGGYAIESAEAELDRVETSLSVQKRTFDDEVEAAVQRFLRNKEQLSLSMKADTIAQRQYDLASKRYLIGKFDVTKLMLSQDAKDKARQALILQQREYWLSYYRLRRLTLYDFAQNKKIDHLREEKVDQ
jgi:outer membrane protein